MKVIRLGLFLATTTIVTACSQSKDPYGDTCKNIATALTGGKTVAWENPDRVVDDGELRIDLFSPQTTANCFFKPTDKDYDDYDHIQGEFEPSPYKMIINGAPVPTGELVKASVMAMSRESKKSALNAMREAKERAKTAVEKSREAATAAEDKIREVMEK